MRQFFLLSALLLLAACQTTPVVEPVVVEPEPEEPVVVVIEETPEPPDQCELLLATIEETRPALEAYDEKLADYTERFEKALAEINKARPRPKPLDCPQQEVSGIGDKEVIGSIEWLYMNPPGRHYRARVDSGAETSSLSAQDIVEFERDGKDWVRFTFQHDSKDEPVAIELPIVRTALIRQVASDEAERRVVVEMDIRLGERLQSTEFTLTDRSRMTYPVLLGRAFLMDLYVVDVARSYTHKRYKP